MAEKKIDKTLEKKLDMLLSSIDRVYPAPSKLILRSFLAGAFGALGATVGLAFILFVLTLLLGQLRVLPGIGEVIQKVPLQRIIPTPRL